MSNEAIFCSKCGAPGQRVESYCRSCGGWLPDPSAAMTPRGRLRRLSPERKQRRMRALELLSAVAALVSGLLTLAVLSGASLEASGRLHDPLLRGRRVADGHVLHGAQHPEETEPGGG